MNLKIEISQVFFLFLPVDIGEEVFKILLLLLLVIFPICCFPSLTLVGVRAGFAGGIGAGLLKGFVLRGGGLGVFDALPVEAANCSSIEFSKYLQYCFQNFNYI